MKMTSPYQMCINNVARKIRSQPETGKDELYPDAFACSTVLAMAFCKAKEEIVADILRAELDVP